MMQLRVTTKIKLMHTYYKKFIPCVSNTDSLQVQRQYTYWRESCIEFIFNTDRDSSKDLTLIP